MSIEINVPPLGESVTEASIAKWFKKEGEYVELNEILLELETDKVSLEINAPVAGILKNLKFKENDTVEVGVVLGYIDEAGKKSTTTTSSATSIETKQEKIGVTPVANDDKILSPAAKKHAAEKNIDPSTITGTGKDGRVTKDDVLSGNKSLSINYSGSTKTSADRHDERVKMSRLRKRIAERLKESQNNAAILTTFNEVDMTNVMNLRKQYKDEFEKKYNIKLGFMSFFTKACVAALQEIPSVNAEIDGDEIVYKNYCDIGVAVGTEQGLVVPVVRNANAMSIAEIEAEITRLGIKARDGKLTMEDLSGGTFTISNGGVYGSLMSTPIINPPQSGILGMHKIQERPMVINGEIKIRPMMYTALSYDHRIIDGKEAVTFLIKVKQNIENPERLLLEI